MALTLNLAASSALITSAANTTAYLSFVGNPSSFNTTETQSQILVRTPGVYSGIGITITANSIASATTRFRFRKNAADGNQTFTVGSSATGIFMDATNTDSVAAADKVNLSFVPGATTGTLTANCMKAEFDTTTPSTLTNSRIGMTTNATGANLSGASTSYYYQPNGGLTGLNTTESNAQVIELYSATYKNMAVNVLTNARGNATTVRFRKNTANGNQVITVAAAATGWMEDTTNTDSVVANDIVNYISTNGTQVGNLTYLGFMIDYQTTSNPGTGRIGSGYFSVIPQSANTVNYIAIAGRHGSNTTETQMQTKINTAFTFKGFAAKITANTVTASSTFMFRKNTADTTMLLTIGASTTGTFSDTSHTVVCAANDIVNYKTTIGATGTSLSMAWLNLYTEQTASVSSIDMTPNSVTYTNKFITKI